ncbi:MAG: FAD:protein FMN transferase [Myxococcota bacterium]|nr:FAD:protein FMN transferase [Myxococcota bacterium]
MRIFRRFPNPRADARAWLCVVWIFGCAGPTAVVPVEDGRLVMGTVLDLALLVRPGEEGRAREALAAAFDSVSTLERAASRYLEGSDLRRLNAGAGGDDVEVDPRLYALLARAEQARRSTRGAFDVSVGPLVELWTRAAERGVAPDETEIAAAARFVGRPIVLESTGRRARLGAAGMSIDLGGIAKGFALDAVAADLRAAGFDRGLLSFGQSSVWALGAPADAPVWRLAVQDDQGGVLSVIELCDQALSVSSSLGRSSEIGGRRYGHVVDPRTGLAIGEARRAIVVASDATLAETLSTALLVLSETEGRDMLEGENAEARVFWADRSSWQTPGWQPAGCD